MSSHLFILPNLIKKIMIFIYLNADFKNFIVFNDRIYINYGCQMYRLFFFMSLGLNTIYHAE